ncbi:MAG: hypothetical protein ACOC55_04275 [Candidatus Natronoplasma sp.]
MKIYYDDGWILIRPSGTEPKYRVYCEAEDEEKAENIVSEHQEKLRKLLEKIR